MARFNDTFADRQKTAVTAKQKLLERFKDRPDPNSPEMQAKLDERRKVAEARAAREAEREQKRLELETQRAAEKAAKKAAEDERLAEEERAREAEKTARESARRDMALRVVQDEADRKNKRDQRYAARKARANK